MKGMYDKWVIALALVNFLIPFFLILGNKTISGAEKKERLKRAVPIMTVISGAAIAFVLLR